MNNLLYFVLFLCNQRRLAIYDQNQRELGYFEEFEQHLDNQVDDKQPWHLLYPNHDYRLFPIVYCRILKHDQYHLHSIVLATSVIQIYLIEVKRTSPFMERNVTYHSGKYRRTTLRNKQRLYAYVKVQHLQPAIPDSI